MDGRDGWSRTITLMMCSEKENRKKVTNKRNKRERRIKSFSIVKHLMGNVNEQSIHDEFMS